MSESEGRGGRGRRWLRIGGGFLLLAGGLILSIPGVPGPGFVLLIAGLVLLSEHYHWARRTLDWARARLHRLKRN
jgi:hypothetical protein